MIIDIGMNPILWGTQLSRRRPNPNSLVLSALKHLVPAEVDCGIPSEVKHTELLISSTKYGSVAQYICEAGFIVQPSTGESTCQLDGRWSEAPICDGECPVTPESWRYSH